MFLFKKVDFFWITLSLILFSCSNTVEDSSDVVPEEQVGNLTLPVMDIESWTSNFIDLTYTNNSRIISFSWSHAKIDTVVSQEYKVFISTSPDMITPDNMAKTKVLGVSNGDGLHVLKSDLDQMLQSLGGVAGVPIKVYISVMGVFPSKKALYSRPSVITFVSSFKQPPSTQYPGKLYLVGLFNRWNPSDSSTVLLPIEQAGGRYEGYHFMQNDDISPTGGGEFKILTKLDDWMSQLGDDGNQSGALKTKVAGSYDPANIQVPQLGFYYILVNLPNKRYQLTPLVWQITGSAVSGATDGTAVMSFDERTRSYSITTSLKAGGWHLQLGDHKGYTLGGSLMSPTIGGSDFTVENPGTYTITLDVSAAVKGKYSLSFVKKS